MLPGVVTGSPLKPRQEVNHAHAEWLAEFSGQRGKRLRKLLSKKFLDYGDADDLCQEVFVRLLRMRDDTVVRDPGAFIFRIAANVACEWRERARNRYLHDSEWLDALVAESKEPCELAAADQELARVEKALDALPRHLRKVLVMHRVERFTREEIAESMGVSVASVKKYLTQALGTLRVRLGEAGDCDEQRSLLRSLPDTASYASSIASIE